MRSAGGSRAAPDLLQFAMSRVLKAALSFDAVARQPGTVGAAVGAADGDAPGGGGGGALRGRGERRGARRATRGRRRRDARPT